MNYRDMGYAASAAAIWGTLGLFATGLNARGFDAGQVAALRVAISAAALILASPIYLGPYLRSLLTHWPTVVAHSLFGVLFYNIAYFYAIQRVGVAYAVSLLYTAPVWALLFATLFLGERASVRKLFLAFCALAGVALIVGAGNAADPIGPLGVAAGLASGACYALYPTLGQRLLRQHIHPAGLLTSSFLISGLCLLAWPGTWTAFAHLATQTHVSTWSLAIGISLFGTLFSYFLFTRGLRTVPASAVAAITTIEPLVAILLVGVFLDERMGLAQYVGVSLILIASILSGRRRQTPSPENSDSKRKG